MPRSEASATIPALLAAAADREPDGVWLRTDAGSTTFARAAGRVELVAQRLSAQGVHRGDVVLVTARTTPAYLFAWLALASLGAVTVPVDPALAPVELAGFVQQVRPSSIVTDDALKATVADAAPSQHLFDVDVIVGDWTEAADVELRVSVDPDDLVVLIPTSGTTGRSKLVMQTHRAYAMAGEGFPYWMELTSSDRLMTSLPLFHINAPAYSVLGSLACGAGLVMLPRFSASGFLESARRHGATEFNAIGAMLEILMRQPVRPDDADTPLRLCYTGPSPAKEWQEAFEERFGLQVVCGYAMSESPYGLIWRRGTRPFTTLGSVRQHPVLGVVNEARVRDDDGQAVPAGGTGELQLRNPTLTKGYWEMPDETAAAFDDGWLCTGDLVTVNEDDTYTFVARRKEVLRRRGQNLSPTEVEQAIASHPDVQEVAVVGVPSELSEEEIKAFVVLRPGSQPDIEELRAWAKARLTAFKVPRFWQLIDSLPEDTDVSGCQAPPPDGSSAGEYDAEALAHIQEDPR